MDNKHISTKQLLHKLYLDLSSDKKWTPSVLCVPLNNSSTVTAEVRNKTARWLLTVCGLFDLQAETFIHAIAIMDSFINLVKVPIRYMRCAGISCLFIAAKINLEADEVPQLSQVLQRAACRFSAADVRRMEVLVLEKLGWSPGHVTSLSFLQLLSTLLVRNNGAVAAAACSQPDGCMQLDALLSCLCHVTGTGLALRFSPCSLALALLSVRAAGWLPGAWLPPVLGLAALCKKDVKQLAACRDELVQLPWLHATLLPDTALAKCDAMEVDDLPPSRTPKRKAGSGALGHGAVGSRRRTSSH